MRKYWLSLEIGPRIPRTNNLLECHNIHVEHSFTENLLFPVKELLVAFIPWGTNESRCHALMRAHSPMECIRGKTDAKVIG